MIRIAVCDDDIQYMNFILKPYIDNAASSAEIPVMIKTFRDGTSLLNEFSSGNSFDIVFLDIEMPAIDGKSLAGELRKLNSGFFLVYVSSYPEEVFDTLKYRINAFIPKTSPKEVFEAEITGVIREYKKSADKFRIVEILNNGGKTLRKISSDDILGFYLKSPYIYMKSAAETVILTETKFKNLKDEYIPLGFYECSRNYLVNIKCILEFRVDSLILINGDSFPVSRRNYKALFSAFSTSIMNEVNR